jgi:hypothetical protein
MVDEWEDQNILASCVSLDILTLLIMDRVHWYLKSQSMG